MYMIHLENLFFQKEMLISCLYITGDNLNKGDAVSINDLECVLLPSLKRVIRQGHPAEPRGDYFIKEQLN